MRHKKIITSTENGANNGVNAENGGKKQIGYKFVAYPVCVILAVLAFAGEFFFVMPVINSYAVYAFGATIESLLIYYPSFICLDIATAVFAIWLTFSLINVITGFCKKHIKSRKAKGESK